MSSDATAAEGGGGGEDSFSWKSFTERLSDRISTTSVNSRHELLAVELQSHIGAHALSDRELVDLVVVLRGTASLYVDKKSRTMVLDVMRALSVKKADVFVKAIASVLDPVVESMQSKSIAHPDAIATVVAPRFALLSWINVALPVPIVQLDTQPESLVGDAAWKRLVLLASRLLWGIAPAHPGPKSTKAHSLSSSAHHNVWSMLRGCPAMIGPMLTILTADTGNSDSSAALIGNVVSAAVRLPGGTHVAAIEQSKDAIIGYIDRALLGSKTPVSYSSVADLRDFLCRFVGSQFEPLFKSSISKMLLRTPETGLPTCLWLLQALNKDDVDLSPLYLDVFADMLASNLLKSSNGSVRQSAADLLAFLADTPRTETDAVKAVDIITKPLTLGRYMQPEQRVAVYQLLAGVVAPRRSNGWASSVEILAALIKMASKETQEATARALFKAIGSHVSVVIKHLSSEPESSDGYKKCTEALKQFSEAALKGLALPERSAVVRQGWAADAVGEPLWSVADCLDSDEAPEWIVEHIRPLVKALAATAEKAAGNPLTAGSSGTLDAHVGFALALRGSDKFAVDAHKLMGLVAGTEKSLVLWDKVYHKCTGLRESVWLLRAVQMLFVRGCDDARLARVLIWVLCRFPDPSLAVAQAGLAALQWMSGVSAQRLWALMVPVVLEEMTLSADKDRVSFKWTSILRAVVPKKSESLELLESMALAANHPAVLREHVKGSFWIPLVQQAGIDPGELCHSSLAGLKQAIRQAMVDNVCGSAMFVAATNLVKDLVFIGGDSVALRLLEFAREDIDPAKLAAVSAEDIEVWQTPAGQLHFDPIQSKAAERGGGGGGGSGGKKKDDQAWAEQLEREIALKKGQARKLTKEEQALVDRQHAKEDEIRARVDGASKGLHRGLALVRAVVEGSSSVASECMLALVRIVVGRAIIGGKAASERLGGAEVCATLLALSQVAEGLELSLRTAVAVGILRARGFSRVVPGDWTRESMEDLATRVYFRLRVSCETQALAAAGFNFLLPLLEATADAGGWGHVERRGVEEHDEYAQMDHAAEQLTMVVDIIGFHAHFGGAEDMPRREMIDLLVRLMAEQPMLLPACRGSLGRLAEAMEGTDAAAERDALIAGLARADSAVRSACLAALDFADLTELGHSASLWLNVGGTGAAALEENAALARTLWTDNGLEVGPELIADIVPFLRHPASEIRSCAARSIALAAGEDGLLVAAALGMLQDAYVQWYISLEPEYDRFGLVVPGTQHRVDIAEARVAVAHALLHLAPLLSEAAQVRGLVHFLVHRRVLGERSEAVRGAMLAAGAQAVASHGAQWSDDVLPVLESFLAERDEGTASYDCIREGVVVLLGRLAQHLPPGPGDARVADAVDQLVAALPTPAEAVQSAVGECLPPLAKRISDEHFARVVAAIMASALAGESYSQRRGGAYGLAGMIKGRGLAALKRLLIIDQLRDACDDKKAYQRRQGALFAFETLSATMGRLFEPYIIQFIPTLLALFGDSNASVREAALDTARVIMGNISGHGVKLILPSALAGLENDQWRTKKGSVEMLGAMAYCAPKQLSVSLPTIVPRIINVLTDAHGQVAETARQALLRFGDVIHNPEIQQLVPTLLAALDEPAKNTDSALRTLLHTAFIHYIDAPSLALVVPILQRGMCARTASTKRNAAQIMGSMATLTDPKDLAPYLAELVPLLRNVLVDPVPEARATSAKALGSLVQKLGEEHFPSLVADLVKVLKSDASGVDRAGAAQGLSEVLSGIGLDRLEGLLPEVLANCNSARMAVREGFMMLLIYLPTTFGDDFQQFLPQVMPPVLSGLADENEQVRNAALRAGRILVVSFATTAIDSLLPDLLSSMNHELWRIRHSSIELLGELLYRVAGISGKQAERDREAARALFLTVDNDGDGGAGTGGSGSAAKVGEDGGAEDEVDEDAENDAVISSNLREILGEKLGMDRFLGVLAALYVSRSDVAAMVRQVSFSVWKSIVNNTPRTVRECLPRIMDIVLVGLASEEYDRRTTAARTLGDLVHKLGEAILSRVVPILEKALADTTGNSGGSIRHGVFIGLSEILRSASRVYIDVYADAMIPLVRRGLCDNDVMVREAAATAFNSLQQTAGPRVIDLVVPPLLAALTATADGDSLDGINAENALEALRELMAVRANVVFPVLIPTLTKVPVTAFNARALASLIQVSAGNNTLSKRLPQILLSLFDSMPVHHTAGDVGAEAALRETVRVIVASASQDEDTLEALMAQLHESVKYGENVDLGTDPKAASRVAEACFAFEAMCLAFGPGSAARGRSVLGTHVADWLRILIELMAVGASELVVRASWSALDALCKAVPKEDFDGYVGPVSRIVQSVTDSLPPGVATLPGFNLAKGVGPLLPIYSQGLLAGSADTKERAVRGMARLVRFTDPAALRPFATAITGPLIRIVGDRHPANVKAAILSTLGLLLTQISALMRPFLPQLQRTFVRGLTEPDDIVRQRAAAALAALIPLQPRLDPLVAELTAGLKQASDVGMKTAMMRAVLAVVRAPNAGSLSPASMQAIELVVVGNVDGVETSACAADPRWRSLRSSVFGALCGVIPEDAAVKLVLQHAVVEDGDEAIDRAAKLGHLAAVLAEAPQVITASSGSIDLRGNIAASVVAALTPSGYINQAQAALQAVLVAKTALLDRTVAGPSSSMCLALVDALVRVVDPATMSAFDSDAHQAALAALKSLAKRRYAEVIKPSRDSVIHAAMSHVRDRNIPVKLAAERCVLYALRLARVPHEGFEGSEEGLAAYVENSGGAASERGRLVLDYQRRVLGKLADTTRELDYASDDEDDQVARQESGGRDEY
ncbi:translational activator of GCN4 [Coemansia sp. BCRC 34301]|nr:translational activator of GCN4 [Coemansia sp. BCRC 34301]